MENVCGTKFSHRTYSCNCLSEPVADETNESLTEEQCGDKRESDWKETLTQTDGRTHLQRNQTERSTGANMSSCTALAKDTVLEMKVETTQITPTRCSCHDDQPPELGCRSQEKSAGGRVWTRAVCVCECACTCVLVLRFSKFSTYLFITQKSCQ